VSALTALSVLFDCHFELFQIVAVFHALFVVREVQLRGERSADALHLDVDVLRVAWLVARRHDHLHLVTTLVVGHGPALQAVSDEVVVALVIRHPEVQHGSGNWLATRDEHSATQQQSLACDARLEQGVATW
jgi:hypothetical protein